MARPLGAGDPVPGAPEADPQGDHITNAIESLNVSVRRAVRGVTSRAWASQKPLKLTEVGHLILTLTRGAAGVLRLPRRALGQHPHHQPHRVDVRHDPAPDAPHQGVPDDGGHAAHDLQARMRRRTGLAADAGIQEARGRHRRGELQGRRARREGRRRGPGIKPRNGDPGRMNQVRPNTTFDYISWLNSSYVWDRHQKWNSIMFASNDQGSRASWGCARPGERGAKSSARGRTSRLSDDIDIPRQDDMIGGTGEERLAGPSGSLCV